MPLLTCSQSKWYSAIWQWWPGTEPHGSASSRGVRSQHQQRVRQSVKIAASAAARLKYWAEGWRGSRGHRKPTRSITLGLKKAHEFHISKIKQVCWMDIWLVLDSWLIYQTWEANQSPAIFQACGHCVLVKIFSHYKECREYGCGSRVPVPLLNMPQMTNTSL